MTAQALAAAAAAAANTAGDDRLALARSGRMEITALLSSAEAERLARGTAAAVALYRAWLDAPGEQPLAHVAWFNLGVLLGASGDHAGAEAAYRQAIALLPAFPEAQINLGSQVEAQGRRGEALEHWQGLLAGTLLDAPERAPLKVHLLNNLGRALEIEKQFQPAEAMLAESLRIRPDQTDVLQHWVHLRQKQCEWPVFTPIHDVDDGLMVRASSPLAMLAAFDDPAMLLYRASAFVAEKVDVDWRTQPRAPRRPHDRIRIGYLSSDFRLHAVSMLMIEVFERHDRARFEVHGFSWTQDEATPMRRRVLAALDHYVPIAGMDDAQAAQAIRDREIDVLIDLQGLTSGARPNILARRPAPIQVACLGFPGTSGMPFVDYVLADEFVLPPELRPYFAEKPLYMPHCFQPSDTKRVTVSPPTRAEQGLPDDRFVFCSFNNNYKITEPVFGAWMRILREAPDSVLWLLADNPWAKDNMVARAREAGVDPDRLLFAQRVTPELYLARYALADLFLDTMPFNGGTTASDALWMGLPLLTCPGRTFPSRMAGSLLRAAGLPELIAPDLDAYVATAVALARNPALYRPLRERLARARTDSPLFDMAGFVRDFDERLAALVNAQA